MFNNLGLPIQQFTYFDTWYPTTDGPGKSLVIIDPLAALATWNDAASWSASTNDGGSPGLSEPTVTIAGRHVFYNNSLFDGNNAAAGTQRRRGHRHRQGGAAQGQAATFANYTSYSRGINGLMIDINNLPLPLTLAQFAFRVGNENNLANWTAARHSVSLDVRRSATRPAARP